MITQVAEAIMRQYNKSNTLKRILTGGLFYQQAAQDTEYPLATFFVVSITHDEIMGGAKDNITEVLIQFSIFSKAEDGGADIALLIERLTDCYDWQTIHVEGYNYLKMQREVITNVGYVDEVWQATIDYSLGIMKE